MNNLTQEKKTLKTFNLADIIETIKRKPEWRRVSSSHYFFCTEGMSVTMLKNSDASWTMLVSMILFRNEESYDHFTIHSTQKFPSFESILKRHPDFDGLRDIIR